MEFICVTVCVCAKTESGDAERMCRVQAVVVCRRVPPFLVFIASNVLVTVYSKRLVLSRTISGAGDLLRISNASLFAMVGTREG